MNRTDRLVAVLLELQVRGQLRAEDLAQQFKVSLRTIYRDLEALSERGVPVVAMPGLGFRLVDGHLLPSLTFTPTEAALLALGGEFVSARVDPDVRPALENALKKLAAVLPDEQRQAIEAWRRAMLFPHAGSSDAARLASLRTAIEQRRVLRLLYHAFRQAAPDSREVEPFSLVYLGERWQVAGYCRLRQGPRLFSLDRILRLDVLPETFTLSERHAPPASTEEWKTTVPEARVRFDPAVERWARDRQPFTFVREELDPEGPIFVYAMPAQDELVRWLLGWGATVRVLEPPELRAELVKQARAIVAQHTLAQV